MNTNNKKMSHNLYSEENINTSKNMPKYLILIYNKDIIVHANNINDALQIIKLNKSFSVLYEYKEDNDEYKYLIGATSNIYDITENNTQDEE